MRAHEHTHSPRERHLVDLVAVDRIVVGDPPAVTLARLPVIHVLPNRLERW
jgi:hypothetical protein